jgi:RNA polymerase sigma factor (sigma-70 family)
MLPTCHFARVAGMEPTRAEQLVAAAAHGDGAAWSALIDAYAGLVWSVIQEYRLAPADAADISQTTWLRLAEHLSRLREPGRVGAWLATTARREALHLLRNQRRQVPTDDQMLVELPDAGAPDPGGWLLELEQVSELRAALAGLPTKGQALLGLLFADPAPSYGEVAALTGMAVGSIGPTRSRYLAQLRSRLEQADAGRTRRGLNLGDAGRPRPQPARVTAS